MKTRSLLCTILCGVLLSAALTLPALAAPAVAAAHPAQSTVIVEIVGPARDNGKKAFVGTFKVNDLSQIDMLRYRVVDAEESVIQIGDKDLPLGGFSTKAFSIPFAQLVEGHKYMIVVQGFKGDLQVERADDRSGGGDLAARYILASQEFSYLPAPRTVFNFTINSANVNLNPDQLVLNLNLPPNFTVDKYDGFIVDDTGQQVGTIPASVFTSLPLVAPLPQAMKTATEEHEYTITLRLITDDDQEAQQTYQLKYTAPPPPGLAARIGSALSASPTILLGIVAIIAVVVIVLVLPNRRRTGVIPNLVEPINATLPKMERVRRNRVRLRVVESPGEPRGREELITRFPCVIGKGDQADVRLSDPQVSRKHAEISFRDGQFYLTDLGSKNGTWVNEAQVHTNIVRPISGAVSLRLGENTLLDLNVGV